jgi:hypothetical protein
MSVLVPAFAYQPKQTKWRDNGTNRWASSPLSYAGPGLVPAALLMRAGKVWRSLHHESQGRRCSVLKRRPTRCGPDWVRREGIEPQPGDFVRRSARLLRTRWLRLNVCQCSR